MQSQTYEGLWHLIIPPVMTLLDDYEAAYKLRGIRIVAEMLDRVPKDLLMRTGVDALLFTVRFMPPPLFSSLQLNFEVVINITDKPAQSSHSFHNPCCHPHDPRSHRHIHPTRFPNPL